MLRLAGWAGDSVTVRFLDGDAVVAVRATNLRDLALAEVARSVADATPAAIREAESGTLYDDGAEEDVVAVVGGDGEFVHPGLLHNEGDFKRMRRKHRREPWSSGWERLIANPRASLEYSPRPHEKVVRGMDRLAIEPENYRDLYNDVAAAHACALRQRVSGDRAYVEKAVKILNAWSSTLKELGGSSDVSPVAGIHGYQFANAAEIMRTYKGGKPEDFERFKKMMLEVLEVFYPVSDRFLKTHNGRADDHYWANGDLCNMAAVMAVGVLCDNRGMHN